jgi:putative ABC transport system permease protein
MNQSGLIELSYSNLIQAFGMILLAMALARFQRLGQVRAMWWSALRMALQLTAVGYLLHLVFTINHPLPVLLILFVMTGFALQVMGARASRKMPGFYRVATTSLLLGCGGITLFFCSRVIGYSPWYNPRYLIPLFGMIVGNSMQGASLAAERLDVEIRERREEIETALCLGATPRQAVETVLRNAFGAALIPTINSMAAMGIVTLPGMMTGQILSGTEPTVAVRYQLAIMCAMTGGVAVCAFLVIIQGYRRYFTPAHQLLRHDGITYE